VWCIGNWACLRLEVKQMMERWDEYSWPIIFTVRFLKHWQLWYLKSMPYSTSTMLWDCIKLIKVLIQMATCPKISEMCNCNSVSKYIYEGYVESNLQWAVNKTSNEKKICTYLGCFSVYSSPELRHLPYQGV
jgi:hypothetical protein